jgi:hypothetical protein
MRMTRSSLEHQDSTMYLLRFLVLLVMGLSSLSAYAQDAKKTADDFAAKWVTARDAGDYS